MKQEKTEESFPAAPEPVPASQAADTPKPLPEVLQPEPTSSTVLPLGNLRPRSDFVDKLVAMSQARAMGLRSQEVPDQAPSTFWQVFCNSCDKGLSDAHYHCGICDNGDYDLCEACVDNGKLCPGEGHWLIKRFVKDGKVVNSTTEKVAPTARGTTTKVPEVPGAFKSELFSQAPASTATRTCNNCVRGMLSPHFAVIVARLTSHSPSRESSCRMPRLLRL